MQFIDYKIYNIADNDNEILKKNAFGSNQKSIIIVYANSVEGFSPENAKDFLTKIIKAIGLNLEQDTLCVPLMQDTPCSFRSLNQFNVKHLFVFGFTPAQMGIQARIATYQPIKLNDCQLFFADNLHKLSTEQDKKRALWSHLKATFIR